VAGAVCVAGAAEAGFGGVSWAKEGIVRTTARREDSDFMRMCEISGMQDYDSARR